MSDHDAFSSDQAAPMGVALVRVACFVLALVIISLFAVGSWYVIDSFLGAFSGQCLGPICIGGP